MKSLSMVFEWNYILNKTAEINKGGCDLFSLGFLINSTAIMENVIKLNVLVI